MSGAIAAVGPWAMEALAASAILIALVLIVRGPIRRTFGAPVAYALWALPVLRLFLPPLPHAVRDSVSVPLADSFTQVGQQVTILIAPAAIDGAVAAPFLTVGMTIALLWGIGAAALLGWHLTAYQRFRGRLLAEANILDRIGGVTVVESGAAAGPLAFGIARRYVAFPRDFAARYDAHERDLALAHELGHHARGDLVANWIALAVLALHWFNPLAWYAFRAFRADQEMANDARVLARLGDEARHAYACAIVKAAHGGAIAAACHLHTVDDLKGRLKMLGMNRTSRSRAMAGLVAIATTGAGALALTASGTQAAERMRVGVETAAHAALPTVVAAVAPAVAAPAASVETVRVVTGQDGKRTEWKSTDAEGWTAARHASAPPMPPVSPAVSPVVPPVAPASGDRWAPRMSPMPPVPPVAPRAADALTMAMNVPEVRSAQCTGPVEQPVVMRDENGGRQRITICTDRIERTAARASARALQAAAQARQTQRLAMADARRAMRDARRAIITNRHLSPEERQDALDALDAEIDRVAAEGEVG